VQPTHGIGQHSGRNDRLVRLPEHPLAAVDVDDRKELLRPLRGHLGVGIHVADGLNEAGGDVVDGDAVLAQPRGQRLGQGAQAALADRVGDPGPPPSQPSSPLICTTRPQPRSRMPRTNALARYQEAVSCWFR
jgi:hypothetical protein